MNSAPLDVAIQHVAKQVVDAAFVVHKTLGPGLLETVYEACLVHELESRKIGFSRQITLPVRYREVTVDAGLRLDLLVEHVVVVEIKAVEAILPVHEAQLLTYLKLTGKRLGLLINFNVPLIKDGIRRRVL